MKTITQLFLMIVVAAFTSTVASASSVALTPLSAQYALALDAESAGSVSFPVIGDGAVQITVPAPPTAELTWTTPDGTAYGSGSSPTGIVAFHYLPAPESRDALGPQHATWLVALESVQPGDYTLSISNADDPNGALPVSVQHLDAPIRTGAAVGLGQGAHRAGQPVVVAAFIHDASGPVPNVTVSATMTMSDGTPVSSATLRNDGVAPDTTAGDGTYVAILTPTVEGIASVRIVINGTTVTGHPYRATHGALLTVGATDELELSGDFQDEGVDSNGDGLFDELRLRFGYIGTYDEAPYGLRVILEADNGQRIDGYGALAGGELIASIPAATMRTLDVDGPYHVAAVILDKQGRMLERRDDLGTTRAYTRNQWDRELLEFGAASEEAVDTDVDGLFDQLRVTVAVEALVTGNFGMSLDLRGPDGNMIATTAIPSTSLQVGTNDLTFSFAGADVGHAGQDGPYVIGNALIYPNFNSSATAFADVLGSTQSYRCRQFVECESDLPGLLEPLEEELAQAQMVPGIRTSLGVHLQATRAAIDDEDFAEAESRIDKFMKSVRRQSGKTMTEDTAGRLLTLANDVRDAIGRQP